MKRILFSLLALLVASVSLYAVTDKYASAAYTSMKSYHGANITEVLMFRTYDNITFSDDVVNFNVSSNPYDSGFGTKYQTWDNLSKIVYYSNGTITGVNAVNTDSRLYRQIGDNLVFSASANLAVFSIDGRMVIANTSVAQGESVSIADLAAGIYVVKANNTTSKIVKK
jgi:hypothetical protein